MIKIRRRYMQVRLFSWPVFLNYFLVTSGKLAGPLKYSELNIKAFFLTLLNGIW